MIDDVSIVTYTTSKYRDVWNMHFGQLTKHAPLVKSYAFSDTASNQYWTFRDHQLLTYDDNEPYWLQYTNCLKEVDQNYVIYSQEDFVLFDDVCIESIEKYKNFLKNSKYDYVRLIRCGFSTPLDKHVTNDIYEVDMNTSDAFSMQATLWKKNSLISLYKYVQSKLWLESEQWNKGTRDLGLKGTFIYNGEDKIGAFHYHSKVYPYVCTAINKGKWNVDQYPSVMRSLFQEYKIDPSARGIRVR